MKIAIAYEISNEAVKREFIESGVYHDSNNDSRWYKVAADLSELDTEQRRWIYENCEDKGDAVFVYNGRYVHKICSSIWEFFICVTEERN